MLCVWAVMRWHVLWRVGWQEVLGMTYPTDIKWTPASTLTYPAIVITVGIMAGMLGLGGGIVLVSSTCACSLRPMQLPGIPEARPTVPWRASNGMQHNNQCDPQQAANPQRVERQLCQPPQSPHGFTVMPRHARCSDYHSAWHLYTVSLPVVRFCTQAPLLLELGVQPAVSAASSQAAMLMSSCTSTVVYLVAGALPKDYGIAMTIIGFVGTLCGQIAFNMLVQRTGRSSILVLILAVLFLLASAAAIIVISNAVTAIVHMPAKLTLTHAHDICAMRGA